MTNIDTRMAKKYLQSAIKEIEEAEVANRTRSYFDDRNIVEIINIALTLADQFEKAQVEILRLKGGSQETFSDQNREGLFKGNGIDYIRHRAEKHENGYGTAGSVRQAQHLRKLATDIEKALAGNVARDEVFAWLEGCSGDFRVREPGEGPYYWRTELTKRLGNIKASEQSENGGVTG